MLVKRDTLGKSPRSGQPIQRASKEHFFLKAQKVVLRLLSSLKFILSSPISDSEFQHKVQILEQKCALSQQEYATVSLVLNTEIKYLFQSILTSSMNESLVFFPAQGSQTILFSSTQTLHMMYARVWWGGVLVSWEQASPGLVLGLGP